MSNEPQPEMQGGAKDLRYLQVVKSPAETKALPNTYEQIRKPMVDTFRKYLFADSLEEGKGRAVSAELQTLLKTIDNYSSYTWAQLIEDTEQDFRLVVGTALPVQRTDEINFVQNSFNRLQQLLNSFHTNRTITFNEVYGQEPTPIEKAVKNEKQITIKGPVWTGTFPLDDSDRSKNIPSSMSSES